MYPAPAPRRRLSVSSSDLPASALPDSHSDSGVAPVDSARFATHGEDDCEEGWSDAHDTIETDVEDAAGRDDEDVTIRADKILSTELKEAAAPIVDSRIAGPSPTPRSPDDAQYLTTDASSIHSAPALQIAEPPYPNTSYPSSPQTIDSHAVSSLRPPPHTADGQGSVTGFDRSTSPNLERRSSRRRSAIDGRGPGRFSGFFSNLIHRRPDREPMPTTSPRQTEDPLTTGGHSPAASRPSSPPTGRACTPPPSLAPPTLQELGLTLSVLTAHLSPSHFSAPPTSGAFLSPHFLLLCHAQGLDVLPLVSPPTPQPYALIRRVSFKSVVIMEERGVLVAIAGRRDGVRVYALDKVREAVEWRLEVEIRRERERIRREEAKKIVISGGVNNVFTEKNHELLTQFEKPQTKERLSTSSSVTSGISSKGKLIRRSSNPTAPAPSVPPVPRPPPTIKKVRSHPSPNRTLFPAQPTSEHPDPPPAYATTRLRPSPSVVSISQSRSRRGSVNNVLAGSLNRRSLVGDRQRDRETDGKGDWVEDRGSDDEAINVVAAGTSGSEALDERTSSMGAAGATAAGFSPTLLDIPTSPVVPPGTRRSLTSPVIQSPTLNRRSRPSNLDLTRANTAAMVVATPPSPVPTLLTLRQALSQSPPVNASVPPASAVTEHVPEPEERDLRTPDPDGDVDDAEEQGHENISFLQALMESRLPDVAPPGTRRPQQPILITASHRVASENNSAPGSPRESSSVDAHQHVARLNAVANKQQNNNRRRRRWSVLDGVFRNPAPSSTATQQTGSDTETPLVRLRTPVRDSLLAITPAVSERSSPVLTRPQSSHSHMPVPDTTRPSSSRSDSPRAAVGAEPPTITSTTGGPVTPSHSRFLNRIILNAFHHRSENEITPIRNLEVDTPKKSSKHDLPPQAPAPKLEYVKLPGTKGSLTVKAVETAKKSFLAILCGEHGEKVELFAGTYRTALTLSRTFILPDSPRSLELQLQGDDLVEVFLVFSQNVFALEPATVRVREVRIGRSERRAARRRARESRLEGASGTGADTPAVEEEETNVNVSISVPMVPSSEPAANRDDHSALASATATPFSMRLSSDEHLPRVPPESAGLSTTTVSQTEELVTFATANTGPYTTFQQLAFAPNFPLATIADECIIPPTYPSFLKYRSEFEPDVQGAGNVDDVDLAQVTFSPPGLPVPIPALPSKWYYRDPKGVIQGPWKASLMQSWYKDGLLPPDLPVRREQDIDFILLKDLRQQCVNPTHPFRPPPPPLNSPVYPLLSDVAKPLLTPISLLEQPRHFGPPALFYSSRGGNSTAIVDNKGRSVLKGRFMWSVDQEEEDALLSRMGDVKRLEAFDVKERSVLVAMRQGGLEAVDIGDALLKPADDSRSVLPHFSPPASNVNRREPFVWRIGAPITTPPPGSNAAGTAAAARLPAKKQSTGSGKSPAKTEFYGRDDYDPDYHGQDEVLFLGRNEDNIYFCERNAGKFRVLRLCPNPA